MWTILRTRRLRSMNYIFAVRREARLRWRNIWGMWKSSGSFCWCLGTGNLTGAGCWSIGSIWGKTTRLTASIPCWRPSTIFLSLWSGMTARWSCLRRTGRRPGSRNWSCPRGIINVWSTRPREKGMSGWACWCRPYAARGCVSASWNLLRWSRWQRAMWRLRGEANPVWCCFRRSWFGCFRNTVRELEFYQGAFSSRRAARPWTGATLTRRWKRWGVRRAWTNEKYFPTI